MFRKQLKTLQAKEWTLSNGAKVLYRNVPELSGKFLFAGSAEGGKSIVLQGNLPTIMQCVHS